MTAETGLSHEAKMIVASNMAVANAILTTYWRDQEGQPMIPIEQQIESAMVHAYRKIVAVEKACGAGPRV
jgi:hypothetical protein